MSKKIAFLSAKVGYFLTAAAVYAQNELIQRPGSAVNPTNTPVQNVPTLVVRWLFIIAAVLAIIYLVMGGIRWITSRGDKVGVEAARKQIIAAIVGLVVVAVAFLIINVVFGILGVDNPLEGQFNLPTLQNPNPATP